MNEHEKVVAEALATEFTIQRRLERLPMRLRQTDEDWDEKYDPDDTPDKRVEQSMFVRFLASDGYGSFRGVSAREAAEVAVEALQEHYDLIPKEK